MDSKTQTTYNEMQFIDGLGKWSDHRYSRADLLSKYIKALDKRYNMAGLDYGILLNHANLALFMARQGV